MKKHYIFSPDTDTYIIGLSNHKHGAETFIDLTPVGADDSKILNLNNLIECLQCDPDLAHIEHQTLPTIFQSLYASTGCDYNPFFAGIGKGSFLRGFYMYAEFISTDGSLSDVNNDEGYLAFLRLVGTSYFLKHRASYKGTKSPVQLYNSCQATTKLDKHIEWLNKIREHVWVHTHNEKYLLPSHTALKLQWLRAVWVIHMWSQAGTKQTITLLKPEEYGWKKIGDTYQFNWDTDENIMAIQNRVRKLTKGCACKRNMCTSKQCGCKQKGLTCGPGCQCINCKNVLTSASPDQTSHVEAQQALYFTSEIEQSLLIGEEVEVGNNSDSSDSNSDTDSDTASSTDSDTADDI